MQATRRTILAAGAVLMAPGIIRPAGAAEFKLKCGHSQTAENPLHIRLSAAAEAVNRRTEGRVQIAVFPSSQLGSDNDMLSQLRAGGLEMMTLSPVILGSLIPVAAISGIGFAFPDDTAVWSAMDGSLGSHVREAIGKAGLVVFDRAWENGFRQATSSTHPITTAADLAGFRMRVPLSPLWTSMFKALGSLPVSVTWAETYAALQTHIADGMEGPLVPLETSKIYEVQKYCSLTNHMWDGNWLLANRRTWTALPPDVRTVVSEAFDAAALDQRADIARLNATVQESLAAKGLLFNKTDAASFRTALEKAGFYTDWKAKFGDQAWATLEQHTGKLA